MGWRVGGYWGRRGGAWGREAPTSDRHWPSGRRSCSDPPVGRSWRSDHPRKNFLGVGEPAWSRTSILDPRRHFQAECTGWPDGSGGWCVRRRRVPAGGGAGGRACQCARKAVGLKRRARELSDTQFAIGMAESSALGARAVDYELIGLYSAARAAFREPPSAPRAGLSTASAPCMRRWRRRTASDPRNGRR